MKLSVDVFSFIVSLCAIFSLLIFIIHNFKNKYSYILDTSTKLTGFIHNIKNSCIRCVLYIARCALLLLLYN